MRGFADGFISVLLVHYLRSLGFSPFQIGVIVTGTLVGSAGLTLAVGLSCERRSPEAPAARQRSHGRHRPGLRHLHLVLAAPGRRSGRYLEPVLGRRERVPADGAGFIGGQVDSGHRTRIYAVYNLAGAFAGAVGALASAVPEPLARALGWKSASVHRAAFLVYAAAAVALVVTYRGLSDGDAVRPEWPRRHRPLQSSRRIVFRLAALFSLDSAASGLVVQSLLVLWLHLRFGLSPQTTGAVFFATGLLGATSQLLTGRLAAQIGLVRTMVFTHLPANVLLALAAFAPRAGVAIALLLARALFSSMDQPARQAFVMAVVPPEERAAAASVTNVPRSLAAATTPLLAGLLLSASDIGWPLLIAGGTKIVYDLLLLGLYRHVPAGVAPPSTAAAS
ncbi:MAG: MFS transporter [Actinomycetota bacterium]|nr:MFS transporter [Actinomycetota bacterium]